MAARPISRNNIIAGLFVVASMVLAVAVSVAVSGAIKRLTPTKAYIIRFDLLDGAPGLKEDSPVMVGGQEVGRVVGLAYQREDGRPVAVDVRVAIEAGITLHEDAWAYLERPLLGSMSSINFPRVGGPDAPVLAAGSVLHGQIAPPSFLTQAGYGPEQSRQLQAIMSRAESFTARLDAELDPAFKKVQTVLDDAGAVVGDVRARTPDWTGRIDSVLAKADTAGDQLNAALANADKLVRDFQEAVEANRPGLDRFVTNIDQAAATFNNSSLKRLDDALDSGRAAADDFAAVGRQFSALVREEMPNIRRILANLRLASDQIKLTMIEVRRNPWRLLYQPKTKELQAELFYDAARTYAEAVSDLRAASEALETLASPLPSLPPLSPAATPEAVGRIVEQLHDAFRRYQEAEKTLLKRMTEQGK